MPWACPCPHRLSLTAVPDLLVAAVLWALSNARGATDHGDHSGVPGVSVILGLFPAPHMCHRVGAWIVGLPSLPGTRLCRAFLCAVLATLPLRPLQLLPTPILHSQPVLPAVCLFMPYLPGSSAVCRPSSKYSLDAVHPSCRTVARAGGVVQDTCYIICLLYYMLYI